MTTNLPLLFVGRLALGEFRLIDGENLFHRIAKAIGWCLRLSWLGRHAHSLSPEVCPSNVNNFEQVARQQEIKQNKGDKTSNDLSGLHVVSIKKRDKRSKRIGEFAAAYLFCACAICESNASSSKSDFIAQFSKSPPSPFVKVATDSRSFANKRFNPIIKFDCQLFYLTTTFDPSFPGLGNLNESALPVASVSAGREPMVSKPSKSSEADTDNEQRRGAKLYQAILIAIGCFLLGGCSYRHGRIVERRLHLSPLASPLSLMLEGNHRLDQ